MRVKRPLNLRRLIFGGVMLSVLFSFIFLICQEWRLNDYIDRSRSSGLSARSNFVRDNICTGISTNIPTSGVVISRRRKDFSKANEFYNFVGSTKSHENHSSSFLSLNEANLNKLVSKFFEMKKNEPKHRFVNRHLYDYMLNSHACKHRDMFLIIIVHSAPKNFNRRRLIRATYGSVDHYNNKHIGTVFMVGSFPQEPVMKRLQAESVVFGDIVQGAFVDSYKNLTVKHIMGMHWYKHYCKAKYILKLDDDVFVNPLRLMEFVLGVKPSGRQLNIWCSIQVGEPPIRKKGSKWFTPWSQYPFPVFPQFCLGFAYLATSPSWRTLYSASETSRAMSMDDVYVTSILAMKARVVKFDFSDILLECPRNLTIDLKQLNQKAIVIDRGNACGDKPFRMWRQLDKPFK